MSALTPTFATTNYRVDPNNFLGHDYEDYLGQMYTLAITKPTEYQALRQHVIRTVRRDVIGNLYNQFFNALSKGKTLNGKELFNGTAADYQPKYPEHKINDFCLSASEDVDAILKKLIDLLIPTQMNEVLGDKLQKIGTASLP